MPVNFSAATKAPPRKTAGRQAISMPEAPRTVRDVREEGLNGLAQIGQALLVTGKQYADAATVGTHFPNVAAELAKLADNYDVIAKPIDLLIQVGPFGALIAAVMPMVAQIGANHGMIPIGTMNSVPPQMLSAQMQTRIAQMQAEMLKAQAQAQAELRQAEQELAELVNDASGG